MTIAYQHKKVLQRIDKAVNQYRSLSEDVTLLAVSKTHDSTKIVECFNAGQVDFGENYLQEAEQKIKVLKDYPIRWHYIGPIQSNKTAKIAQLFNWVHSVDRIKIAKRLSAQRSEILDDLNICLQINISNETTKSGVNVDEIPAFLEEIKDLPNIKVRGFMCIPKKSDNFSEQRQAFHLMHQVFTKMQQQFPELDTLSMGMSGDLEAAIAEGSTIVRIGTDIFGPRNTLRES